MTCRRVDLRLRARERDREARRASARRAALPVLAVAGGALLREDGLAVVEVAELRPCRRRVRQTRPREMELREREDEPETARNSTRRQDDVAHPAGLGARHEPIVLSRVRADNAARERQLDLHRHRHRRCSARRSRPRSWFATAAIVLRARPDLTAARIFGKLLGARPGDPRRPGRHGSTAGRAGSRSSARCRSPSTASSSSASRPPTPGCSRTRSSGRSSTASSR